MSNQTKLIVIITLGVLAVLLALLWPVVVAVMVFA